MTKMKHIQLNINRRRLKVILLPLLFLILTYCITISSVMQPSYATVGETIEVSINVDVVPAETSSYNVILGVLIPEEWDPSKINATYTSDNGSGTFSPASDGTYANQMMDLVGIGENYGKVKWVALVSDGLVSGTENDSFSGQIKLALTVGDNNLKTQLGYIVGTSGYGITDGNIGINFPDCFEVMGGDNPIIDLCGPLPFPVVLAPAEHNYNDIIKISFDATKGFQGDPTALMGVDQVFLCGTVTANEETVVMCDQSEVTLMNNVGTDKWEIAIWPKQFFNLSLDADITAVSFTFTDANGDNVVVNPDSGEAFQIIPNCTN